MCKDAHSWAQLPSLTWGDLTVEKWSDTIKVQCQNCRKREEERQWNGTMRTLKSRHWSCRTRSEWRKRANSLTWTMESLFSAAKIARLKSTVSLPYGKRHGLYKRVPRTNATVCENWYSLNCYILRNIGRLEKAAGKEKQRKKKYRSWHSQREQQAQKRDSRA